MDEPPSFNQQSVIPSANSNDFKGSKPVLVLELNLDFFNELNKY